MRIIIFVILFASLIIGIFLYKIFFMQEKVSSVPRLAASLKVIGWIPNWDQEAAVANYKAHVQYFQYVSVFWYRIDAQGALTTYQATQEDTSFIDFVHANHEKIFALVANLPDFPENKDWDSDRVQKVISSEDTRQKHIADLVRLVTEKQFDGLDIDYEALQPSQKDDFTRFIEELAFALHKKNKLLGVAVYPPDASGGSYGPDAQDLPALAKAADQLYVMTYLAYTLTSGPGPTGSILYVANSMDYALNTLKIPRQKVFMGIGLMGIAWRQDPDGSIAGDRDDISFEEVLSISQNANTAPSWDSQSQSPLLTFTDQNGRHIIWFENGQSVGQKIALAKILHLGGVAFWRLGGEDDAIWQYLK